MKLTCVLAGYIVQPATFNLSTFNFSGKTDFDARSLHHILESKRPIQYQSADTIAVLRRDYRDWAVLEAVPKSKPATLALLCRYRACHTNFEDAGAGVD